MGGEVVLPPKLGGSGRCLSRLQRSWQPVCAAAAWTDAAAEAGSLLPCALSDMH